MKKFAWIALPVVVVMSSSAFAQAKTRAQVYQELIEARQNGLDFVTDASYPDVNPMFQDQVARMKAQAAQAARAPASQTQAQAQALPPSQPQAADGMQ